MKIIIGTVFIANLSKTQTKQTLASIKTHLIEVFVNTHKVVDDVVVYPAKMSNVEGGVSLTLIEFKEEEPTAVTDLTPLFKMHQEVIENIINIEDFK